MRVRTVFLLCQIVSSFTMNKSSEIQNKTGDDWDYCLATRYIVGENFIDIQEAPFQLALERSIPYKRKKSWFFMCGASILTEKVAITSRECVVRKGKVNPFEYQLKSGTSTIFEGGTVHSIKKIIPHLSEDWPLNMRHDIALLFIDKPYFIFSDSVQPLKLPKREPPVGAQTMVTGWGTVNPKVGSHDRRPDPPSRKLKRIVLPIINKTTCDIIYTKMNLFGFPPDGRHIEYFTLGNNVICAGYPSMMVDTCKGDSGGPLYLNDTLYGIVSWGLGCAQPCQPSVFANVFRYRMWIKYMIETNS